MLLYLIYFAAEQGLLPSPPPSRMYVVTPLSERQYRAVLEDVQNATAADNKTESEMYLRKVSTILSHLTSALAV